MEMKRSQKEFVGATSSRTGYGVVLLHAVHTEGERERGGEVSGKGRKGDRPLRLPSSAGWRNEEDVRRQRRGRCYRDSFIYK